MKNRKNWDPAAFLALILLLCLVPSLGMLRPAAGQAGGNETLTAAPALRDGTGRLNTAYLSQLADYIEDHYFLRQNMISAWSALNAKALRTSITGDVVLGKDGWLYFGDTLPDYTGTEPMDQRELFSTARNLSLMAEYCQGLGARFLFTIVPNKNTLYPEHMPAVTAASGPRNAELLAEALEAEAVPYADLFTLFQSQEETLYFSHDSHWNSKGAALAADTLNQALGRTSAYFQGPFSPEASHKGDLYDMLYPTGTWLETDWIYGGTLDFDYDAPIRSAENLTIMTHSGGEGSLLMFRDSFGNLLYPYMAGSFASALFSRSMPCRLDLAAQREADCVVLELVERNLRYLLRNIPLMPAPSREAPAVPAEAGPELALEIQRTEDLPGCVLASGTLPLPPDAESPVYLETPEGVYEAFLMEEDGFGLYVPDFQEGTLIYASGGQARRFPLAVSCGPLAD